MHSVLVRLRDDKPKDAQSTPWAQLASFLPEGPSTTTLAAGAATVLNRRVWVKETKGRKDVRKLVVWKTNHDEVDPSYPAYVVHWTDYSSARKTPLTREVRPASTEAMARGLAEAMVTENVKKGWAEVTV
jgi:hypothetical protein